MPRTLQEAAEDKANTVFGTLRQVRPDALLRRMVTVFQRVIPQPVAETEGRAEEVDSDNTSSQSESSVRS